MANSKKEKVTVIQQETYYKGAVPVKLAGLIEVINTGGVLKAYVMKWGEYSDGNEFLEIHLDVKAITNIITKNE